MSDISQVLDQEAIADSLVDPAGAEPLPEGWGWSQLRETSEGAEEDSNFDRNLSDAENQAGDYLAGTPEQEERAAAASADELDQIVGNQSWREQQPQAQQAEAQQEAPEPTPAEVQAGILQLDQAVEELGLNDPSLSTELAYSLTVPFGADPSSVDAKGLGSAMSKMVLSASQIYEAGNFENLGPISVEAAKTFTSDFLKAVGVDARMMPVDSRHFASTLLSGAMSFIEATKVYGLNASLDRLNSPEAAEFYVNHMMQSFGYNQPVDREYALRLADTFGKYVLGVLRKLPQAAPRPAQREQRSSRQSRKSHSTPRMRTNRDIFGDDVMDHYYQQHGRL